MDLHEALTTRRSRGKMRADAPPREVIERVLEAGVHAPNHHDTQPWRFFVLTNAARSDLGEVLARALKARVGEIDPEKLAGLMNGERLKPMRSPVVIAVGVTSDRDDAMTKREDLQAASAAMQNMLIAANSQGLAAIWRTGDGAYDDAVKAYFNLRPQDEIAGFLYLGYPDESFGAMPERTREYASRTEWRG